MVKDAEIQMRKRNMKIFPTYKKLAWDYLFFYTINFLFLTQVKGINPADVVLIEAFYALFGIIMQIPAVFIVEFLGRKNSIIFGNIVNCLYMVVVMFSKNLFNLIIAEMMSSLAFAIKETAEPSLLNESIPKAKSKDKIFAKINEKGAAGYYFINAVTKVLAGWLYQINAYIPMILSLATTVLVTIISAFFIEPVNKKKINYKEISISSNIKEIESSLKFILKSERLKSLLLYCSLIAGLFCALDIYEVSLLEELNISSGIMGMIFAGLGIISSFSSKKQEEFHQKYKNKSLAIIGFLITISCMLSGIIGVFSNEVRYLIIFIIIMYIVRYIINSIYYNLTEKYLRNFANEKIDTKIYTVKNFLKSIVSAIIGIFASFLLDRMNTSYCMIILGVVSTVLLLFIVKYMKKRVGLKPEDYSEDERKYDELKETVKL
ncbi:MAG: MFS transporter [Clostridia bacterium]|nr:MFS transporter [Clostridia bacterium]